MSQAELGVAAVALAVDGWTAEAVAALRADGIDSILLKGPAIAGWLYDRGEVRGYGDADLLVAPATLRAAEQARAARGYELRDPEGEELRRVSGPHARTWWRPADGAVIDLHHTLPCEVAADVAWPMLSRRTEELRLAGCPVATLDEPGRALMVALHAAHHGARCAGPLDDLNRAIARLPDALWARSAVLADELLALPQFAEGLRLAEGGAALAARIGLAHPDRLRALVDDGVASGFERLAAASGFGARLALLGREAFPPPSFLRWWAPRALRRRALLPLAYAHRLGWLIVKAGPSWRAWRRTQTEAIR